MMSSFLLLFIPYIAIEHGPVEIVDLPMQNCDFPSVAMSVYQRVIYFVIRILVG